MEQKQKKTKDMLSHETIYKIMQWLPPFVLSLFFIKNMAGGQVPAMLVIGICLVVYVGVNIVIKLRRLKLYVKEYVLAIALPILVFVISLFSGASYSDDFPLYLAVLGMTGLYLEPRFTLTQIGMIDIFIVIMYIVHPEKAESLSQYILCAAVFVLAASLYYQVIKRGKAFIELGRERAEEAEKLLESIRAMGVELQQDFADSSARIEESTQGLQEGSTSIANGAGEVVEGCNIVHGKIVRAEEQIEQLNNGVRQFEEALNENHSNVEAMSIQVDAVSGIIHDAGSTFRAMEAQMKEIAGIARQISDISFRLTILSLNASVESAHAGAAGSGFEVLAAEMRDLSESSSSFSEQVSDAVKQMQEQVARTSERFAGSEEALMESERTMEELQGSFERLNEQFAVLYNNIESQNTSITQIEQIFDNLNQRVSDMHNSSQTNRTAVDDIVDAMAEYKENVGRIVENTQKI